MKTHIFYGFAMLFVTFQFMALFTNAQSKKPTIAFVTIETATQGAFTGASKKKGFEGKIEAFGVNYDEKQGSIKQTIVIHKYADAATPKLQAALAKNEILRTVSIQFFSENAEGKIRITETYLLTNGVISKIDMVNGTEEVVTINCQKIYITENK